MSACICAKFFIGKEAKREVDKSPVFSLSHDKKEDAAVETVKKFYEALSKDEAMRARLSALNERYKGAQPDEAAVAAEMSAFAKAEGFDFGTDALAAYAETEGKELSEEQLEAVAGGKYNRDACCCLVGGSGKDPETGHVCSCVLGGGGSQDSEGYQLVCIGPGEVDRY